VQVHLDSIVAKHPAATAGAVSALRKISLEIKNGEQVAVIGPSGAGKTTLLQCIACALKPSEGQIRLDQNNPWSLSNSQLQGLRGQLFLAPQVPPLPPRQRVVTAVLAGQLPQMTFLQSLRSLFYPKDIPSAEAALSLFDLSEKLFDRVDRLSGGERQRVGLARALVAHAKLLLVDEPLSALDPTRSEQAMVSLTQAAKDQGSTLICTLHQVPMALKHFNRIIGLRDGEVTFDLASALVTPERLHQLYANKLDELTAPTTIDIDATVGASGPAIMHCR
jgi:phosphonate transport system ATP-binding protein